MATLDFATRMSGVNSVGRLDLFSKKNLGHLCGFCKYQLIPVNLKEKSQRRGKAILFVFSLKTEYRNKTQPIAPWNAIGLIRKKSQEWAEPLQIGGLFQTGTTSMRRA